MARTRHVGTAEEEDLKDKLDESRAEKEHIKQLREAALAVGSFRDKLRFAIIPAMVQSLKRSPKGIIGSIASTAKDKATNAANAPFRLLSAAIQSLLAPLTALSLVASVLGSPSSGFGMLLKSAGMLGDALAPILLPAVLLLSAAILVLGDYVWSELMPHFKDFATAVFSKGIPAIETFADKMRGWGEALLGEITFVKDMLNDLGEALGGWISKFLGIDVTKTRGTLDEGAARARAEENARKAREKAIAAGFTPEEVADYERFARHGAAPGRGGPMRVIPGDGLTATPREELPGFVGPPRPPAEEPRRPGARGGPGGGAAGADPGGFIGKMLDKLKLLGASMMKDAMPPSRFEGISQAHRTMQMALFNEDPLEAERKRRHLEVITAINAAIDEVRKLHLGAAP